MGTPHEIGAKLITHTVEGLGTFYISASQDPEYPGMEIELVPEQGSAFDTGGTNPKILIEAPCSDNKFEPLRALIWNNSNTDDADEEIELRAPSDN